MTRPPEDQWLDCGRLGDGLLPALRAALEDPGYALVKGLAAGPVAREAVAPAFTRLGTELGALLPQNGAGELLSDVRDFSDTEAFDNRGYRSAGELTPHTDPPSLIALYCLNPAKRGGENALVSAEAIHAGIEAARPDLLAPLYRGFRYWIPSEKVEGEGEASSWRLPVFARCAGRVSCLYYRPFIEQAAVAEPLSATELAALDFFDRLAAAPENQIRFTLARDEAMFLHNRAVLHAREDYEDWPDPAQRRHLLRLWIDAPAIRPTVPAHELGARIADRAGARGEGIFD